MWHCTTSPSLGEKAQEKNRLNPVSLIIALAEQQTQNKEKSGNLLAKAALFACFKIVSINSRNAQPKCCKAKCRGDSHLAGAP